MQKQVDDEIVAVMLRAPASLKQRLDTDIALNRSSQSSEMKRLAQLDYDKRMQAV
jgi:hypothetical protein